MDEKEKLENTENAAENDTADEKTADAPAPIEVDNRQNMPRFALAAILAVAVVLVAGVLVLSLVLIDAHNSKRIFTEGKGSYPERQYDLSEYPYKDLTYDYNKVGSTYLDITDHTAEELADSLGYSYEEFLMYYRLPKDMPKELNSNAAMNLTPLDRVCELRHESFAGLKEDMGWDDSISEDTTYGEAMDKTAMQYAVGTAYLDEFKAMMGLDSDVSADTPYGDIRPLIEKRRKEMYDMPYEAATDAAEYDIR